jgi:hypothetical protein
MILTRELHADCKGGPPRWQPQNRGAVRTKNTSQFKGFLNKAALGRLSRHRFSASRRKFCALFSGPNSEF